MADILNSLYDTVQRNERRKRESNMTLLRAINTRAGMIVLGTVLLVVALVLIGPQLEDQIAKDDPNAIVIDLNDFDFGDEKINSAYQEMLRKEHEQQRRSEKYEAAAAIVFCVAAAGCYVRAALPWKKEEQEGTISEKIPSKETEEVPVSPHPVENAAPPSAETDSREDRLQNLKHLYEAGILSREEYDERKKKL